MFATATSGLGPLLRDELSSLAGVTGVDSGNDGRADVVLFTAEEHAQKAVLRLALADDIFAEIGRTLRSEGDRPRWIAGRIWRPGRVDRTLSTRGALVRPVRNKPTFRVVTRVLQEKSFPRTQLRREFTTAITRGHPHWRLADPAELEVWVTEYRHGKLVAGLRLSDAAMRQHEGRDTERRGALRPTVAAAMVRLAGAPDDGLLDPCCGSGTILAEATTAGWHPHGSDIDPDAVRAASRNVPNAHIGEGDARHLATPDASFAACVSNLPFGQQYDMQGDADTWLQEVLAEMARVVRPGGRVILLAPKVPWPVVPRELTLTNRCPIRLLGTKTTIWSYNRT